LVTDAAAEQLAVRPNIEVVKSISGNKQGCQLMVGGIVRWTSKTFAPRQPDPDGHGWNCDQFGNPVASKAIPGSDPADRI